MSIKVFLVDDHGIVRQGLRLLIDAQNDMDVVGEASDGREVSQHVRAAGANLVVVDVSMPGFSGSQTASELRAALPDIKILALTRHGEQAYVRQMMNAGANGYILKQTKAEHLIDAIRAVAQGETYLDPSVTQKMVDSLRSRNPRAVIANMLSAREQEIATLIALGHTNKEIANALDITVKTVETHKANIMAKLELTSRAELVRLALMQGWLEEPIRSS